MPILPKVSVILTSYNHEKYICEAIDSVLDQSFSDFELIIWDDASTDSSWNLIKQYTDHRIKAFRNDVRKRGAFGINKSIAEIAKGEYIAIHHSDDVWDSNKLEKQIAVFDTQPELDAVFTWVQIIDEHGSLQENDWFNEKEKSRWQHLEDLFKMRNHLAHPSAMVKKRTYQELGFYRNFLPRSGDAEMWSRLAIKHPIYVVPEKLTIHRVFSDQSNASGKRPEVKVQTENEWNFLRSNYLTIDNFDNLVSVFPSLEHFRRDEKFNTKFLLVMVCINECSDTAAWRLGIGWLYDLFRDPSQALEISDLYSFTYQDLVKLTIGADAFELPDSIKTQVDLDASVADPSAPRPHMQ